VQNAVVCNVHATIIADFKQRRRAPRLFVQIDLVIGHEDLLGKVGEVLE
jgi:hypothetical protein